MVAMVPSQPRTGRTSDGEAVKNRIYNAKVSIGQSTSGLTLWRSPGVARRSRNVALLPDRKNKYMLIAT
jgi:hypothetical protein